VLFECADAAHVYLAENMFVFADEFYFINLLILEQDQRYIMHYLVIILASEVPLWLLQSFLDDNSSRWVEAIYGNYSSAYLFQSSVLL